MESASEGKLRLVKSTVKERLEVAMEQQVETYALKPSTLGLEDVARGHRVKYLTTVYNVSGDDSSGIAVMLYPDGEFVAVNPPKTEASFWEFDETLAYERYVDESGKERVRGNSWTTAPVVWDGSVGGSINPNALTGEEGDTDRKPISRREFDASLGGDWLSTGELWKALERGTSMQGGPQAGKVHLNHITEWGSRAA